MLHLFSLCVSNGFQYSLLGEVLSFENFIYSIFEFITALVEAPRFKKTVKEYLEDILFHTMIYMQITEEQVRASFIHKFFH